MQANYFPVCTFPGQLTSSIQFQRQSACIFNVNLRSDLT